MQHSLQHGKKALTLVVVAATILWSLGLAAVAVPQTARAATMGSLIKGPSLSTVYYYGSDGMRHSFPNLKTFNTWYSDFSGLVTVSDSELAAIPLGSNVVYRPGSRWVKVQSLPQTYAVTPSGALRWVETEAVASGLAGSAWNTVIDDVPEVYFSDYTTGTSLMSAAAYNGMYVNSGASKYMVWDGKKRLVSAAGQSANRIQDRFFLTPSSDLLASVTAGADLSAAEGALTDPAQLGGSSVTPAAGGLTVSLASDTPSGTVIPSQATNAAMLKFNLSANGGDATVSQVSLKMGGLALTTVVSNVYLYEGETRRTNGRTINSTTRVATFSGLNWSVKSGETRTFTVIAEMANNATGGDSFNFQLESVANVVSNATVSGSFPVVGSTMSTSTTDVGTVDITKNGSITNPTLGENDAKIGQFQVAVDSAEHIKVQRIAVLIRTAKDHSDFKLWQNNTQLGAGTVSGDTVTFVLATPYQIDSGNNRVFHVTADIGGKSSDSVRVYIEETTDFRAVGVKYGFGVGVDIGATGTYDGADAGGNGSLCDTTTDDCSFSTVQGGQLTFAFNGPVTSDIPTNTSGVVLYKMRLTAENFVDVRDIDFILAGGSGTANFRNAASTTDHNYQNLRLVNPANGDTKMGPIEMVSTSDTAATVDFTDDFTMAAGEVIDLELRADTKGSGYDITGGDTIRATLDVSGITARDSNNQDLTATDIVPSGTADLVGNTMTVRTASLTINVAGVPASGTFVRGTSNVDMAGLTFAAGAASKATISAITLNGYGDSNEDSDLTSLTKTLNVRTNVTSCSIYDGQTGALIKGPEGFGTFTSGTGADLVFSGFSWTVPAGQTYKMVVRCNLANVAITGSANDVYVLNVDAIADVTTVDADGNSIAETLTNGNQGTPTSAAGAGVILQTVANGGTLTVVAAGDQPTSTILLGNSTSLTVAKWKFTAANEAQTVKKITLENGGSSDAPAASLQISYPNAAGETVSQTGFLSAGDVTFDNMSFYVPNNGSATLTVSVNTSEVSTTGASSGSTLIMNFNGDGADSDFESTGAGSQVTIDESNGNIVDRTANTMEVRKTKPTVSLASGSPSGAAIVGLIETLRFSVAADSRGEVTWSVINFKFNSTDNANNNWNQCASTGIEVGDFSIYKASDLSTALDTSNNDWSLRSGATGAACSTADMAYVSLNLDHSGADTDWGGAGTTGGQQVAAGTTETYVVKVDVSDTNSPSAVNDDSFRLDLVDETEANLLTGLAADNRVSFEWDDSNTTGTDIDGDYVKNLPVIGGSLIF